MQISVFRGSLRIVSKAAALEFYSCVKQIHLIPADGDMLIRVEPGCLISMVSRKDVQTGQAVWVPNLEDSDGSICYRWRKYINAWLSC